MKKIGDSYKGKEQANKSENIEITFSKGNVRI